MSGSNALEPPTKLLLATLSPSATLRINSAKGLGFARNHEILRCAQNDKSGERRWEAELYRLKGQLTLQQSKVQSPRSKVEEAEECFQKAIEIARHQSAKSLELRAVMSLSRLWQQQGKKEEARHMLAEIYGWFTEGFDTKDLQEAKTLLEELGEQEVRSRGRRKDVRQQTSAETRRNAKTKKRE